MKIHRVYCDGKTSEGYIEHPGIYLNVENQKEIICPYCNKVLVVHDIQKDQ